MALMDVTFPYGVSPGALQMTVLGCVHEVYGVQTISFDQTMRTVKVEYDVARLGEDEIAALLRGTGVDLTAPLRDIYGRKQRRRPA